MHTKDKVSVILPTCNRYPVALQNIKNILKQRYSPLEILVCDDSDKEYYQKNHKEFMDSIKDQSNVKYFYVARFDVDGHKDYGLARGRNTGVVEANGEFIVLLDDRITPKNEQMVATFANLLKKTSGKMWYFGDKGANKRSFVENCSAIRRQHLIEAGMFNERIDKYGGMSKELFFRYTKQGFNFIYVPDAMAVQLCKSSGWDTKEKDIVLMKKKLNNMGI